MHRRAAKGHGADDSSSSNSDAGRHKDTKILEKIVKGNKINKDKLCKQNIYTV